jgi:hypothetical protein
MMPEATSPRSSPPDPRGLTGAAVESRLTEVGFNESLPHKRQAFVVQLLRRFASPLVAIL